MSSYPTPNARDLAELELIELQGKLAELDRQIRTVNVECSELSSLGKGKRAYELRAKVLFLTDPIDFQKRKRSQLGTLNLQKTEATELIQQLNKRLGKN